MKQTYLTILVTLLILAGSIFLVLKPLAAKIQHLSRLVEQQQGIIKNPDSQKQYQAKITQLKAEYEEVKPKLNLLKQSLLDKEKVVEFIKSLERASAINNLQLKIQALPEEKDSLNFGLELVGAFPQLLSFLEQLENNQFMLKISNIKIQALYSKEKQLTGQIQSNVEIKVYLNQ